LPSAPAELLFGRGGGGDVLRVEPGGGHDRAVPGTDDGGERVLLEVHRALDGLHQVGDEVVAALELDVDLLERVLRLAPEGDQPVVRRDEPSKEDRGDDHQCEQHATLRG
jgi:hypothetical protein